MILIGSFSWLCHGTASMLCSMFPPSSMAYMQTGFRTPEIYTVVILSILGLNSRASEADVVTFYWITALVVGLGLFSWLRVCRSKPAMHYFALKDESYNETDAQVRYRRLRESPTLPTHPTANVTPNPNPNPLTPNPNPNPLTPNP